MGNASGISLRLRRAFDGGILAIVGVKSMAGIGFENRYRPGLVKHWPNRYNDERR